MTTTAAVTSTLGEGDDLITYDVHGDLGSGTPLFLFGSPMDAVGFGSLRAELADRPVVTYDPRGTARNPLGTSPTPPELHAEDLHRVVEALGVGPVDCFGTSGGAVNLMALAAAHPGDLAHAVAHEPPTVAYLPDRAFLTEVTEHMVATYQADGFGPGMAEFIALVMHDGELPADWLARPATDPAAFGLPAEDDGDRTNAIFRNSPTCQTYVPDLDALRALGDRLTVGVGADSHEEWPARGARSVAAQLGVEPVVFPGSHNGFSGGEYGQPAGDPAGFARVLRGLLDT
jgi:pimeloyl-ACP methyl ester carboxylesterase